MKVVEVFQSIQGEGAYCGVYATFVRLAGCNLSCPFCDTAYAREEAGEEITPEALAARIGDAHHVVWTGGEPLLQQDEIYQTIGLLRDDVFHEVETNGSVIPSDPFLFASITVSPKGPIDWEAWRRIYWVDYKFVATVPVAEIARFIEERGLVKEQCWVMPLTGPEIDPIWSHRETAEACITHGLNVSPRLQVLFGWGRGQ